MFIIKYYNEKKGIYYKYVKNLYGANLNEYPYIGSYYVGYVNSHGHEILDINYIYEGKIYTFDEYQKGLHFSNKKINNLKDKILKIIDVIKE